MIIKQKIVFLSPPFAGHYGVLIKLAKQMITSNPDLFDFTFIITGWENKTLSQVEKKNIQASGIRVIELQGKMLRSTSPFHFTFSRAVHLMAPIVAICKQAHYIIYDFFAVEGYVVGNHLAIPAICSIPAIMSPFNPRNPLFAKAILDNEQNIKQLEDQYQINLLSHIQMLGDGFFIPSSYQNIHWSWPKLIEADDYNQHRNLVNNTFMRPNLISNKLKDNRTSQKKIIYISFGTIVTGFLFNHFPSVRSFIENILTILMNHFGNNDQYEFIVAMGKMIQNLFDHIPSNFQFHGHLSQEEVLKTADVFITHGGGNSVNESIDVTVPMIVIPFFGDQHQSAYNINKLNIGISFLHAEADKEKVIDAASGLYERSSLSATSLISALGSILDDKSYIKRITTLKLADIDHIANLNQLKIRPGTA